MPTSVFLFTFLSKLAALKTVKTVSLLGLASSGDTNIWESFIIATFLRLRSLIVQQPIICFAMTQVVRNLH